MKLAIVLVFLIIAVYVKADDDNSDEKKAIPTSQRRISHTSSSSEKRWRPIFPKNARKFVVTMKPTQSNSTIVNRVRKKPIMSKVIPREVKVNNEEYRQNVVTRRPLMKFAKFTVKPFTPSRIFKTNRTLALVFPHGKNYKGKAYVEKKENHVSDMANEENSSEEKLSNNYSNNGYKRTTKSPSIFNVIETRIETSNQYHSSSTNAPKVTKRPTQLYLSSEEEEDRREFIFIKPRRTAKHSAKAMRQSAESNEVITTEFSLRGAALRQKRSINVIEEENLGTTVSGFKFTGKPASLSSDLVFKNINV